LAFIQENIIIECENVKTLQYYRFCSKANSSIGSEKIRISEPTAHF
jgi:hypothetical protein